MLHCRVALLSIRYTVVSLKTGSLLHKCNVYLVHPQLSNNDIPYGGGDFSPSVMISRSAECEMCDAKWNNLQIVSTKLTGRREILPIRPISMLDMEARYGRMMGYLNI